MRNRGTIDENQRTIGNSRLKGRKTTHSERGVRVRSAEAICTRFGIGCPRIRITRSRCGRWRSRRATATSGYWVSNGRRSHRSGVWGRARLVPRVEQVFHSDSYGYRPGRSALDAVEMCARRSRQRAWAVKIDLRAFFDTVDHELMVKALRRHVDPDAERWIVLYVQRWLPSPNTKNNCDDSVTTHHPDDERFRPRSPGTGLRLAGHSYDNAIAEAFPLFVQGRVHSQPRMRPRGGWRGLAGVGDVEWAVAEYIDWFNPRRSHGQDRPRPTCRVRGQREHWSSLRPEPDNRASAEPEAISGSVQFSTGTAHCTIRQCRSRSST